MRAIEFEATPDQHILHIPEDVPDGVPLKVVLLWNEADEAAQPGPDLKELLAGLTVGLDEDDLKRAKDFGREAPQWDS
jgi:hypothetical protein